MVEENKLALTALDLEYNNKQRAHEQARQINRGLTRLKKISSRPEQPKKAPVEADKTGSFIVVPIGELQAKNIEDALCEAGKSCSELSSPYVKPKKKWFKWDSK